MGFSQSGNYYLSNFSPGQDLLDNVCFQMIQDREGLMYFATRSGILQYDGKTWSLIPAEGAVYTITIGKTGEIYWAGVSGWGVIQKDKQGNAQAKQLSRNGENIFQSIFAGEFLYLLSEDKIFVITPATNEVATVETSAATGSFSGIYELAGKVYVTTSSQQLYQISGNKLQEETTGLFKGAGTLVFTAQREGRYLAGFASNEIFLFEKGRSPRRVELEDQEHINQSVIVNGSWVNSDLFVVGTLRGGLIFINLNNGKTREKIDYSIGLPDNEIFALYSDHSQGVWAAHEYGFTRVVPYLPFRSFSYYSGLQGNILCATSFNNTVYVGTSLGLFRLEKQDVFEDRTYFVDVPGRAKPPSIQKVDDVEKADTQPQSKRKGWFRLFRKKTGEPVDETVEEAPSETTNPLEGSQSQAVKIKKTDRVLKSSTFVFQRVRGIEAKVTQIIESEGRLVAAGLGGTFEILGLESRLIREGPTRYIYATEQGEVLASTYSDQLKTLAFDGKKWILNDFLLNFNDQVTHIFESGGDIWMCALDKVYRVKTANDGTRQVDAIRMDNPNFDPFVGVDFNDKAVLVNSKGFYGLVDDGRFKKIDTLAESGLSNYFAAGQTVWHRDNHGWHSLAEAGEFTNSAFLNLFANIRYLDVEKGSGDLWVVTGKNELYKINNDRVSPYEHGFRLILRSVSNGDLSKGGTRLELRPDEENHSVTIQVIQPDYLAAEAIEYRFQIKGIDKGWSDWSPANDIIEIPYLPAGEYVLLVESKNIFGRNQYLQEMSIEVIPPYWKQTWFYGVEVLVFSFLVILSFRLSTRYRIVSRLLMLLTIIMLIQLIETIIGQTLETNTSPVIDFFVQVVIAMLVLPVEGYLRNLMLRSLEFRSRFYKFISPRSDREGEYGEKVEQ
jgi:hypothetical protein